MARTAIDQETGKTYDVTDPSRPVEVNAATGKPTPPTAPPPPPERLTSAPEPPPTAPIPTKPAPAPKAVTPVTSGKSPVGTDVITIPKGAKPVEYAHKRGEAPGVTDKTKPTVFLANGVRYYARGSAMHKLGYRTSTELAEAKSMGLQLGYHKTAPAVGKGSVVVKIKGKLYRVAANEITQGSGISQTVRNKLDKDQVLIPVIATSGTGEQAQLLITPKQAEKLNNLKGEAQFDYAVSLGVIPGGATYRDGGYTVDVPRATAKPGKPAEKLKDISAFIDYKGDLNLLDAVKAGFRNPVEYQEAGYNIGQGDITEASRAIQANFRMPDGTWVNRKTWNNLPGKYQTIGLRQGYDTMQKAVSDDTDKRIAAYKFLTPYFTGADIDNAPSYDVARFLRNNPRQEGKLKDIGFTVVDIVEAKKYNKATAHLQHYQETLDRDIPSFLRTQKGAEQVLKDANFTKESIADIKEYNRAYHATGADVFVPRSEYVKDNWKKEWGPVPFFGIDPQGFRSSDKQIQKRLDKLNIDYDKRFRPSLNQVDFVKDYFKDKGWEYDRNKTVRAVEAGASTRLLTQYDNRQLEATKKYKRAYGTSAIVESGLGKVGFVIPAARAFTPTTKLRDISAMEWAITGAQVGLLLSGTGIIGGTAVKQTISGSIARHVVNIGAGSVFGVNLAVNWDDMSTAERAINFGITALIFAPYLKGMIAQTRNIIKGKPGVTTKSFLANEAKLAETKMAEMRASVVKNYGANAADKLDDVYSAQTSLVRLVREQDELAVKALGKMKAAETRLKQAQKALADELKAAETHRGIGATDVPAKRLELKNAQKDALKTKNQYDDIIDSTPVRIKEIETKLGDSWDEFINLNKNRPGFDDVSDFYSRQSIVRYTRNIADDLAKGSPTGTNITQLKADLNRVTKELAELKEKYPTKAGKWANKLGEQIEIEGKILGYQAGNAEVVAKAITRAKADLKTAQKTLKEAIGPDLKLAAQRNISTQKARISVLEDKYRAALKGLKVEVVPGEGESIGRGGGRTLTKPPSTRPSQLRDVSGRLIEKPPRTGGGRASTASRTASLLASAVASQVIPDVASGKPMEIDIQKIRKIATEAGEPAITENPSIRKIIEEEYRKAYKVAKKQDINDKTKLRPLINTAAITDAINKAAGEGEQAQPQPEPKPEPEPQPQPQPTPTPTKPVTKLKPEPPGPKPIPPDADSADKKKRELIKSSNGAVTWKQGKLHGKRIWQVGVHPYTNNANWFTVIGSTPQNATVVDGPRSAYQTVKLLYGVSPPRTVTGDIGIMDVAIEPQGRKKVGIRFKPDPKQLTTGDFRIGRPKIPTNNRNVRRNPPRFTRRTYKKPAKGSRISLGGKR